jgi:hypothetical protein
LVAGAGAQALAEALESNRGLIGLNLAGTAVNNNPIGLASACAELLLLV